jgi:hypothetical protein
MLGTARRAAHFSQQHPSETYNPIIRGNHSPIAGT